jgi:hypothetical protein
MENDPKQRVSRVGNSLSWRNIQLFIKKTSAQKTVKQIKASIYPVAIKFIVFLTPD